MENKKLWSSSLQGSAFISSAAAGSIRPLPSFDHPPPPPFQSGRFASQLEQFLLTHARGQDVRCGSASLPSPLPACLSDSRKIASSGILCHCERARAHALLPPFPNRGPILKSNLALPQSPPRFRLEPAAAATSFAITSPLQRYSDASTREKCIRHQQQRRRRRQRHGQLKLRASDNAASAAAVTHANVAGKTTHNERKEILSSCDTCVS